MKRTKRFSLFKVAGLLLLSVGCLHSIRLRLQLRFPCSVSAFKNATKWAGWKRTRVAWRSFFSRRCGTFSRSPAADRKVNVPWSILSSNFYGSTLATLSGKTQRTSKSPSARKVIAALFFVECFIVFKVWHRHSIVFIRLVWVYLEGTMKLTQTHPRFVFHSLLDGSIISLPPTTNN